MSGRGSVHCFTVNYQQWLAGSDPYVIALVEIEEQHDIRLTTNLVECRADEVRVGMLVEVVFENHEDVWLPLFRPSAPHERARLELSP